MFPEYFVCWKPLVPGDLLFFIFFNVWPASFNAEQCLVCMFSSVLEHQGLYVNETSHTHLPWHPAHCHQPFLTLTYFSCFCEECLVCVFISFFNHQGVCTNKTSNTSTMSHSVHCHGLLVTLTYFLCLAEQCLVSGFSSISGTQRSLCKWNFVLPSPMTHPAKCQWQLLTLTYFSPYT